jgi:hypothetical protein
LDRPSGHQGEDLALAGGEAVQAGIGPRHREQLPDDLGVERGAAAGNPAHRVDELVGADDAVLEEVAHPARVVLQQPPGVGRLDPLGERGTGKNRVTRSKPG